VTPHLTVLGGGPAGLAAGWEAALRGLPCTVLEAEGEPGGFCRTFRRDGFGYDAGAHRIHARDPLVTTRLRELMGASLHPVERPSRIFQEGGSVGFPLSPGDLLASLGPGPLVRFGLEMAGERLRRRRIGSFEEMAVGRYGRSLAGRFLLNYSRKLWGIPPHRLHPQAAGGRLGGISPLSLAATLLRKEGEARHLEGRFLYPRGGIGELTRRLAGECAGQVETRSRVVAVRHDGARITRVQVEGAGSREVDRVLSSLPLPDLVAVLDPPAPRGVRDAAAALAFRDLVLVALFLDIPRVTPNASLYFPTPAFPFTRISEPVNRCPSMAPPGKTSLVAEIPCQRGDAWWTSDDGALGAKVVEALDSLGLVGPGAVEGAEVRRLTHAYPLLDLEHVARRQAVMEYLARFANLHLIGRNGLSHYGHIHDVVRRSLDLVASLAASQSEPASSRAASPWTA
jgi:protoporphyrinogen oxidase